MIQRDMSRDDDTPLLILTVGTSFIGNVNRESSSDRDIGDLSRSLSSEYEKYNFPLLSVKFKTLLNSK